MILVCGARRKQIAWSRDQRDYCQANCTLLSSRFPITARFYLRRRLPKLPNTFFSLFCFLINVVTEASRVREVTQCCTSVGSRQVWQDKATRHSAAQRTVASGQETDLSRSSFNVRQITCIFFRPRTFLMLVLEKQVLWLRRWLAPITYRPPYKSYKRTKNVHCADHCVGKRVCLEEVSCQLPGRRRA